MTQYFDKHIFFCTNARDNGQISCQDHGALEIMEYCKTRVKLAGFNADGKVRVNRAGCLGRCKSGPVAVVYPEGTWYTYVDKSDIDEIVDSHLQGGVPVARLLLNPSSADD